MAQKTVTYLVDDLDGGDADHSVRFNIDGTDYEIDLSADNTEQLLEAFAPYVAAARRVPKRRAAAAAPIPQRGPARVDRMQRDAIREWANRNGFDVSPRGRISGEIVDRYNAEAGRGGAVVASLL